MSPRNIHLVHLLIRENLPEGQVGFLVAPHPRWKDEQGRPLLALPAKKTVLDPSAPSLRGTALDVFVDVLVQEELGVPAERYALEQELRPVYVERVSPTHGVATHYTIFPVDLWVHPAEREPVRARMGGMWLTCDLAASHPQLSPTARRILRLVARREAKLCSHYRAHPSDEGRPEAPRRLLAPVPDAPSMDALAKEWLSHNLHGVRILPKSMLDTILDAGTRAFNLRVADPYLPYQMQGQGFTWSFFTHKDPQDCHVHGAPTVEIYGILEGEMEVWWKPYYERGTAAWSHNVLRAGDWLEVDSLQCHIVHWRGQGRGVVFKAGPGPLAEVGRLGVKGKTTCAGCPCMKPREVREWERRK
jgi:hypothetical protein